MRELDLARDPSECFFERNLQIVAQIPASRRAAAAHRLLCIPALAEEHVEDVAEAASAKTLRKTEISNAAAPGARTVSNRSIAVVLRALLNIRKHFVGPVSYTHLRA